MPKGVGTAHGHCDVGHVQGSARKFSKIQSQFVCTNIFVFARHLFSVKSSRAGGGCRHVVLHEHRNCTV